MTRSVHTVVLRRFDVPAERVFDACLDPASVSRWMAESGSPHQRLVRLTLDARVGGTYSFVVDCGGEPIAHTGEYLAIDRPGLLVFTWTMPDGLTDPSRVIIEITPQGQGCEMKLTHVGHARWSAVIDAAAAAWTRLLDALERALLDDTTLLRA